MVEVKTNVSVEEHICLNNVAFRTKSLPLVIGYNCGLIIFSIMLFIIKSYFIAWMFIGVMIFFNVMIFGLKYIEKKRLMKKITSSTMFNYQVTEEHILIEVVNKMGKENGILKYEYIYKVIEDKDYFYLFINSMNAYIMSKKDLSEDSIKYIEQVLKQKIKKYKSVK